MNLDESVTPNECCRDYLPEPRLRQALGRDIRSSNRIIDRLTFCDTAIPLDIQFNPRGCVEGFARKNCSRASDSVKSHCFVRACVNCGKKFFPAEARYGGRMEVIAENFRTEPRR